MKSLWNLQLFILALPQQNQKGFHSDQGAKLPQVQFVDTLCYWKETEANQKTYQQLYIIMFFCLDICFDLINIIYIYLGIILNK